MTKINPFGVFLERLQQPDAVVVEPQQRSAESPAVRDVTGTILQSLRSGSVDPTALLDVGLDLVEVGRALDRLRSLDSIQMVTENGRQMIRRGPKYEEVCELLALK